jgi:hypothetical protein
METQFSSPFPESKTKNSTWKMSKWSAVSWNSRPNARPNSFRQGEAKLLSRRQAVD